ncbi:acyl-CoA synthetase [Novosphingobium sediminis]|uniref:Acyl-CoA synthetase n=1 Tax=Novosphingobium sediminis TaxID=707214 RepID=A0A512AG35_9SPHN|nr:acetate--CoA ligase family protein [Novosphingobium sediminis]GEN98665.1 acyl-CoA synthetase [Novosphingobium sediminis]
MTSDRLTRLLRPRSLALVGGKAAEEAVRQCRALGFAGPIWPVNPKRSEMAGLPCFPDMASLPEAPDAVFVAAPAPATIALAAELQGTGGAICYAADFAESGEEGRERQAALLEAAQGVPLIGPNCYGMLNLFDRVALWPDQHGCLPIEHGPHGQRGVAIVSQSGNLALNLTMQTRGLPIGYVISVGNCADVTPADLIEALIADERVSAIGLHLEGLGSVARFSEACLAARKAGIPLVALKTGASAKGAALTMSHTSSLAGADALTNALFARYGVARAHDPATFLETLKLLHVAGPLRGRRITSASCSGGEASLTADLAEAAGLETPDFPAATQATLEEVLGPRVHVANPLDYHTYIWGDLAATTACFSAMLGADFEASLLILDFPRTDRCSAADWDVTLAAYRAACRAPAAPGTVRIVVSSLSETMPETVAAALLAEGILPAAGLPEALRAIAAAASIGEAWANPAPDPLPELPGTIHGEPASWDEVRSKAVLAAAGVPIARGKVLTLAELEDPATQLPAPFPLVLKAVGADLAHKTEVGGVALNLSGRDALLAAAKGMSRLSDTFLIEEMVGGAVAELIVGVGRDPQFGLFLTLGAGGIFVELLRQTEQILLPASHADIEAALARLPLHKVLTGYRGKPGCDMSALVNAIAVIAGWAMAHADRLEEMDVNPLLALTTGAVAVDALIRIREPQA